MPLQRLCQEVVDAFIILTINVFDPGKNIACRVFPRYTLKRDDVLVRYFSGTSLARQTDSIDDD